MMCSTTTTTSISLPIALVILILAKVYAFIVMSAFQKITYNVILKFKKNSIFRKSKKVEQPH